MTEDSANLPLVVIDTTELWQSLELNSAGWPQILAWCKSGLIDVAVTDVTLQEAERHYKQQEAKRLRKVATDLGSLNFLPDGLVPSEADLRERIEEWIADYPQRLRTLLSESSVLILPLPNVGHDTLLRRDLETRKPFQQNGKGYRDALNWESLLEHLRNLKETRQVVFVSANTNDFADENKQKFHASLEAELSDTTHGTGYFQTLKDAVESLREYVRSSTEGGVAQGEAESVHELMRAAVVGALQNLYGASVETTRDLEPRSEGGITMDWLVPIEFTDVTIEGLSPDEDSLELDIYDANEDTYLAHASIDVEIELDGFVHKADYSEDLGLMMFNPDWTDHYMNVGLTNTVRMTWYVTVIGNSVEEVSFDSAEPIDTGGDEDHSRFLGMNPQGAPIPGI